MNTAIVTGSVTYNGREVKIVCFSGERALVYYTATTESTVIAVPTSELSFSE